MRAVGRGNSHTDGDNQIPPMVDTPPSSEPTTSTVVDVSHAQTETMTEEERKALIAKHRELAVRFSCIFQVPPFSKNCHRRMLSRMFNMAFPLLMREGLDEMVGHSFNLSEVS